MDYEDDPSNIGNDGNEEIEDINISKSFECLSLQNSKYIIVENDINKLRDQYKLLHKYNQIDKIDGFTEFPGRKQGQLNL